MVAYLFGVTVTTYAVTNITYDLNVDFFSFTRLPLSHFYQEQVVPLLLKPFNWVGLDLDDWYGSLIAISGVGGSVWAGAEFRLNAYLFRYPFPNFRRGPGTSTIPKIPDWTTFDPNPGPPGILSLRSLLRFPHALLLQYSFLGLLGFVAGVVFGIRRLARFLNQIGLFLAATVMFALQLALAHFERPGDDDHLPTRVFLWLYKYRRSLDDQLEASLHRDQVISLDDFGSAKPLGRAIAQEVASLSALVLVALAILFMFN